MKFNIVIPFYKNYDTIEALLLSIADQDHKDYDVTIVVDGHDKKAEELLMSFTNEYSFTLEVIKENSGASAARNIGASISRDSYESILFFIDADCKLMPGILHEFNTRFELDSSIDFCYGNYRFEIDKPAFISQEFDPFLLETMNYIPTMSPIKRKAFESVGGFDNRKYFQDWGLFYKLGKKGYKGSYLGDKYFVCSTKSPTEESISGSQGLTLSIKCAEFRKYYGIEDKNMVTSTWGAPLQAIQRAKMLGTDYVGMGNGSSRMMFPSNYNFPGWKNTYMVGCYNESIDALSNHMTSIVGRPIYHFIGSDVFTMYNNHSISLLKHMKKMFDVQDAILLTNSSRCKKEMKECGFDTELVFTPIYQIEKYIGSALPKTFTVGVYISDSNKAHKLDGAGGLSNIPLIMEVAKALPHINFKFFGIDKMYDEKDNIEFCGRIPEDKMVKFINECSMVVRATVHDGFPQLPIQFMLCGRQALVSCPDEEMKFADKLSFEDVEKWEDNKSELITKICECKAKEEASEHSDLSEKAHEYYSELMSVDVFKEKIEGLIK